MKYLNKSSIILLLLLNTIIQTSLLGQNNNCSVKEIKYFSENVESFETITLDEFKALSDYPNLFYFNKKEIRNNLNAKIQYFLDNYKKYPNLSGKYKTFEPSVMITIYSRDTENYLFVNSFGMVIFVDSEGTKSDIYDSKNEIWDILYKNVKGLKKTRKKNSSIYIK